MRSVLSLVIFGMGVDEVIRLLVAVEKIVPIARAGMADPIRPAQNQTDQYDAGNSSPSHRSGPRRFVSDGAPPGRIQKERARHQRQC